METTSKQPKDLCADDVARLRAEGHRITPQRLNVLMTLKNAESHVTAEEIHAAIVPQQPYLDLATVYRTLHWLRSVGLVVVASENDGRQRYEYRSDATHHHHLACQNCGEGVEIAEDIFADLKQMLHQRYGFTAEIEHAVVSGYCHTCSDQLRSETPA